MNKQTLLPFAVGALLSAVLVALVLRLVDNSSDEAPPAGAPRFVSQAELGIWEQIAEQNDAILHAATPPPRIDRMILPWEPTEAVLLATELEYILEDPGLAPLYSEILAKILPHTEVICLFHRKDRRLIPQFVNLLEKAPRIGELTERLEFVPAEIGSPWIRDYGPLFGYDKSGKMVLFDTAYIDPRIQMSNLLNSRVHPDPDLAKKTEALMYADVENLRGSDISPSILAGHLQVNRSIPTVLTRPPLLLAGGDLQLLDSRTALVSQSTLEANGGRTDFVESLFKKYFGIQNVHYLAPFPGETIEHLDFVMQILGPDSILVAKPPEFDDREITSFKLLKREASQRMARNKAYLQKTFPKRKVIAVPTPPPILPSEEQLLEDAFAEVLLHLAEETGVEGNEIIREKRNERGQSARVLNEAIALKIRADVPAARSLSNERDKKAIISHYLGEPYEELRRATTESLTHYRSYLNSLQIVLPNGKELILIPRYAPLPGEDPQAFERMEAETLAAYRQARPAAQLEWIDCSQIIDRMGAVHCMSMVLPRHRP